MAVRKDGLGDRMAHSSPVDAAFNAALDEDGDLGPSPRAASAATAKKEVFVAMNIRMSPELHRALRMISLDRGESVNSMLVRAAEKIVARNKPL